MKRAYLDTIFAQFSCEFNKKKVYDNYVFYNNNVLLMDFPEEELPTFKISALPGKSVKKTITTVVKS